MNANTNINVLGGILDAMLANLVEMIDNRIEAKRDETLQTLWNDLSAANERIVALEKAVENHKMASALNHTVTHSLIDEVEKLDALKGAVMDLDSEEFRTAVIKIINTHTMGDEFLNPLVTALIDNGEFVDAINEAAREVARSEAEEAVSDHNSEYCHDDIHESSEIDEDAVREVIEEVLNNVTVTLKI